MSTVSGATVESAALSSEAEDTPRGGSRPINFCFTGHP